MKPDTEPVPIPSASSPEFLARLLEHIAEGIRSPRALADLLGCNLRTLQSYLHAGEWLGFLEDSRAVEDPEAPPTSAPSGLRLTRLGLDFVYGDRRRERIWADAVWAVPFVRSLLSGWDQVPPLDVVVKAVQAQHPDLAMATAVRRASAVRSLVEPALKFERRKLKECQGTQLLLGFSRPRAPVTQERVVVQPVGDEQADDPALYRVVLQALLDEGEIGVSHIRGLLDHVGAGAVAVGGMAEMALRRGDARRWTDGLQDKLVVTPGAIQRRDLSDTVASVALSDPDYREYLSVLIRTEKGDPSAAIRYGRLRARFAHWDWRLYGGGTRPQEVARSIERLLLGRPLEVFPLAGPQVAVTPEPPQEEVPFLLALGRSDLKVCLPPSIEALSGGVAAVNRILQARQRGPQRVMLPTLVDPRAAFHGGLLYPGEKPPRAVADQVSLRLLALSRVPYLTFLAAFLLLHRRSRGRLTLRYRGERLHVVWRRRDRGQLLDVIDRIQRARGWLVSRRFRGGLDAMALKDVAVAMGIAQEVDGRLILSEEMFVRMRSEPEDGEVYERLSALCNAIEGDLGALADEDAAPEEGEEA